MNLPLTAIAAVALLVGSFGPSHTGRTCDDMLQAPVFSYEPDGGMQLPCGLQEDEAGDVWSYIHTGHTQQNGAFSDEDAREWLLLHQGDGEINP